MPSFFIHSLNEEKFKDLEESRAIRRKEPGSLDDCVEQRPSPVYTGLWNEWKNKLLFCFYFIMSSHWNLSDVCLSIKLALTYAVAQIGFKPNAPSFSQSCPAPHSLQAQEIRIAYKNLLHVQHLKELSMRILHLRFVLSNVAASSHVVQFKFKLK